MIQDDEPEVFSDNMDDFLRIMPTPGSEMEANPAPPVKSTRLNLDPGDLKNGLGQLVLTVVKLLHELMERQAIHRMEAGSLNDEQVERIGTTLLRQTEELDRLRREFNLEEEDLNLDLGPLGRLF